MNLPWIALGLAAAVNLVLWRAWAQRRANRLTPVELHRWRRAHRCVAYPLILAGVRLWIGVVPRGAIAEALLQLVLGAVWAVGLRGVLALARAWCVTRGIHLRRYRPVRIIEATPAPVDLARRIGVGHVTRHGAPRTQTGAIYFAQQRYRECLADPISERLGRRVDGISEQLALFLWEGIGDEPGWCERLDLKCRMWLEPTLRSVRFDSDNPDQHFMWDLDEDRDAPRVVLVRYDEALAAA
jgi:hypothetical protein